MKITARVQHVAVSIIAATVLLQAYWPSSAGQKFDSPLPTPSAIPAPTVVPVTSCQAQALAFVARNLSISVERLIAGTFVANQDGQWTSDGREEWIEFPFIGQKVCYVTILAKDGDEAYRVALDEQGQVVHLEELQLLTQPSSEQARPCTPRPSTATSSVGTRPSR